MAIPQSDAQPPLIMTEAEYLEFEDNSQDKHEFVNGKVYAMAGSDWKHAMITQSASSAFYAQLRGGNCRVSSPDLRLKVASKKVSYRYPDIMITCGDLEFAANRTDTILNPTVIVEVLSPSTALEDRNTKLDEYTQIDTVREYLLVTVDEPKIERFKSHPDDTGEWLYLSVKGLDAEIEITSLGCVLKLADVYEQVDFDREPNDDTESPA